MPVALIHTSVAALIAPGADRLGGLGLDQLLEHQAHRAADQLRATTGAKRLPQLCRVNIRKGHRCVLLDEWVISLTEDHADGPPSGGPLQLPQSPPLGGTLPLQVLKRTNDLRKNSDKSYYDPMGLPGENYHRFTEPERLWTPAVRRVKQLLRR